jgi:hypothetical protein
MDFLLSVHSILRWFIILAAVLAVIKYSIGWATGSTFKGMDRGLLAGFSGLLDLQMLLGLVYFLWSGFTGAGFPLFRWEHMGLMILAAALGHIPRRLKSLNDKQRFLYSLLAILGSLVFIFLGILVLQGG